MKKAKKRTFPEVSIIGDSLEEKIKRIRAALIRATLKPNSLRKGPRHVRH